MKRFAVLPFLALAALAAGCGPSPSEPAAAAAPEPAPQFDIMEARIADVHAAIKAKTLTTTQLVEQYLERIKAYNGTCVKEPDGMLGRIETIPNAGQINALSTLNLRPATREQWGFDARKARSMTDAVDADPAMPDALEVAAALDQHSRPPASSSGRCTASSSRSRTSTTRTTCARPRAATHFAPTTGRPTMRRS